MIKINCKLALFQLTKFGMLKKPEGSLNVRKGSLKIYITTSSHFFYALDHRIRANLLSKYVFHWEFNSFFYMA